MEIADSEPTRFRRRDRRHSVPTAAAAAAACNYGVVKQGNFKRPSSMGDTLPSKSSFSSALRHARPAWPRTYPFTDPPAPFPELLSSNYARTPELKLSHFDRSRSRIHRPRTFSLSLSSGAFVLTRTRASSPGNIATSRVSRRPR